MGKKKPQKTKELSVAIAESSSAIVEQSQPQQQSDTQVQTPRKRGRPRKIVEKITQSDERKEEEAVDVKDNTPAKKVKVIEEQPQKKDEEQEQNPIARAETSSTFMGGLKKGEGFKELPRRRTRRKSKPRKSS